MITWNFYRWGGWIRIFGYGISVRGSKAPKYFSERYGYTKYYYFGPVKVKFLSA